MQHRSRYLYLVIFVVVLAALLFYRTLQSPTITKFGGVSLRIEYALSEAQRERGLGGRESVPDNYGMLFVFPVDGMYGFWMKDMLVPIDMFWLDAQGHVVSIARDVAPSTYPNVFYPTQPARYVLETVAGFADRYGIATGTPLQLKNPEPVSE